MDNKKDIHLKNVFFTEKNLLKLLMIMFCAGELAGSFLYCAVSIDKTDGLNYIIESFFCNKLECTFVQGVINSFSGTFILIVICALLGTGAFFQITEVAVPFFYGLGVGMLLAEMNSSYGLKGFFCSCMLIVPYVLVSALIIIISARESFLMSSSVAENILNKTTVDRRFDFKLYFTKFALLILITALAATADGFITFLFADFWKILLEI